MQTYIHQITPLLLILHFFFSAASVFDNEDTSYDLFATSSDNLYQGPNTLEFESTVNNAPDFSSSIFDDLSSSNILPPETTTEPDNTLQFPPNSQTDQPDDTLWNDEPLLLAETNNNNNKNPLPIDPNPSTNPNGIPTFGTGVPPTVDSVFCDPGLKLICCRGEHINVMIGPDNKPIFLRSGRPENCISVEDLGCPLRTYPAICCKDLVRLGRDPEGVGEVWGYDLDSCGEFLVPKWMIDAEQGGYMRPLFPHGDAPGGGAPGGDVPMEEGI